MVAANKVVRDAVGSSSRAPLAETTADMMSVRSDPDVVQSLDTDLSESTDAVVELLLEAMENGLDSEMRWQATQIPALRWELSDRERAMLPAYPIQGHMSKEVAEYMHLQLRYEVNAMLAGPLDGSSSVDVIPEQLGALTIKFGDRVGGAVSEAFFAGVQLGVRTVAEAINRAR